MQVIDHKKNIIEIQNVSFSYGDHEVLKDINLSIHKGDYIGLVGGNGTGKTTLLKILLGLLAPQTGSVQLFGQNIADFKEWPRIGYVPQKVTNFDVNFPATVEEVVLMGRFGRLGLFHGTTAADIKKAHEALREVGMFECRHRLVGDLSGGQQQRVFIARALAGDPEVIFLDEPTVGVEKDIKDEFYALLRRLNKEFHLTIILVTHDVESMSQEAMHIACIDRTLVFHDSVGAFIKESHKLAHPHS